MTKVNLRTSVTGDHTPCAMTSFHYGIHADLKAGTSECPTSSSSLIASRADEVFDSGVLYQEVFVLKNLKKFGRLLAVNGSSHAIVLLDNDMQPQAFTLNEVFSP